jgi:hypothetical protein
MPPASPTTADSTTTPNTSNRARTPASAPLSPKTNVPMTLSHRISVGSKPGRSLIAKQGANFTRRPGPPAGPGQQWESGVGDQKVAEGILYSQQTARDIDDEIGRLVARAYKTATQILEPRQAQLHVLAGVLLERETLGRAEFEAQLARTPVTGDGRGSARENRARPKPPKRSETHRMVARERPNGDLDPWKRTGNRR